MSVPLRVLIVTDSFPPLCGGSGWSTWELARGLIARGHHVEVVKIDARSRSGIFERQYEGIPVTQFCRHSTNIPLARNFVKNERLWGELETYLTRRMADRAVDIVHAQHVMSTVPSIRAAHTCGVPVVATVRDYWPVCYWSDLIYDPAAPHLCPECSVGMMTRCVRPRAGAASFAAWPAIPYMRTNLATKRRVLARAGAVIGVSHAITDDLKRRAPELGTTAIYTIPNPVDITRLDEIRESSDAPMPGPYVVYVGKLAINKGTQYLLNAYEQAKIEWPLVIAGDGPLRAGLEQEARGREIDLHVLGWIGRTETLTWIRHAALLAFPSYGPESLSRVLIEAAALGVPIAAMDTGGTRDILRAGDTALLSGDAEGFARDLARLARDESLRTRLGQAAREDVRSRFAAPTIVEQIEQVYRSLLLPRAA
jgi:glycosyltransferase involved in cell wall biosynthesis